MKQKDYLIIAVVVIISIVISVIISNKLFSIPANRQQTIQAVGVINTDFKDPDAQYFNKDSIDPSQLIPISLNINNTNVPFVTSTQ